MATLKTGEMIGRYRMEEELAASEIVAAFRAYDEKLERHVLLKFVKHSKEYSTEFTDYFLTEARTLAQLSHPSIAKVLDFGRDQSYLYLVMEGVTGTPLSEQMGKPMDWRSAVDLVLQIAQALAYAHANNVIHRDLKPDNILMNAEGRPVLSDFSIAKIIEDEETRDVTGTNVGLGTPTYMSPEQGKGMPVDYRADIYSLGIIFFEMVTGQPPFQADNSMETLILQVISPPPSPKTLAPDLPTSVEKIILATLKKDPDERFQSMDDLVEALTAVRKGQSFRKTPRKRSAGKRLPVYVVAALVLALLLGAGWGGYQIWNGWQATPAAVSEAPTSTVTPSPTKVATAVPTATMAPTQTVIHATSTLASFATRRQFSSYPAMEDQPFKAPTTAINSQTVFDITEILRIGTHPASVGIWSQDDSSILLGTSTGVYFYDPVTFRQQGFYPVNGWISCLALSSDESRLAVGDEAGAVHVLNALTGEEFFTLTGHTKRVTGVAFSPDLKQLASASEDLTVRIWNLQTGEEQLALRKHSLKINSLLFSNNGQWVISGSDDFHVIFWNPQSGEIVNDRSYGKRVTALALSNDDSMIAIGLSDATALVWSTEGKTQLQKFSDTKQVTQMTALGFSPNGSLLVSGAEDGIARVWNVTSGAKISDFQAIDTGVRSLQSGDTVISARFSNEGTRLFTLTRSSLGKVWSVNNMENTATSAMEGVYKAQRVEFSANGNYLLAGFDNQVVQVWDLAKAKLSRTVTGVVPPGNAISPDNQMFVILQEGLLNLYNPTQAAPLFTLYDFPPAGFVSFLPDSKILSASASRNVVLWSTATGLEINPETYKYESNCRVAYTKDQVFLAAGSLFGVNTNPVASIQQCQVSRNSRRVSSEISPDGEALVQGLENGSVEVARTGEELSTNTFKGLLTGKVLAVAVSPDELDPGGGRWRRHNRSCRSRHRDHTENPAASYRSGSRSLFFT